MEANFSDLASDVLGQPLTCTDIGTVQVNMGLRCNQHCAHCHLMAGPDRTEEMTPETVDEVIRALGRLDYPTLDVTGGAPELNAELHRLVREGREAGCPVMVRTNLTALMERDGLPDFLACHQASLIASMPCYREENVERQRGPGVYGRSINALKRLNELGYGLDSGLELNLVYNPGGPFLPPNQQELEQDYKEYLREEFSIGFNHLFVIVNMAIGRFAESLEREDALKDYGGLLRRGFNPDTVESLMCRHQVSVGPDGTLYDCDFNLALGIPVAVEGCRHVSDLCSEALIGRTIATGEHCFGCTAGAGSSCKGALTSTALPLG